MASSQTVRCHLTRPLVAETTHSTRFSARQVQGNTYHVVCLWTRNPLSWMKFEQARIASCGYNQNKAHNSVCGLVPHGIQMWHQLPAPYSRSRRRPGKGHACMLHDQQFYCDSRSLLSH